MQTLIYVDKFLKSSLLAVSLGNPTNLYYEYILRKRFFAVQVRCPANMFDLKELGLWSLGL